MKNNKFRWQVLSEYDNIEADAGFLYEIKKAIFLALLEKRKINIVQYNLAIELLSKKHNSDV